MLTMSVVVSTTVVVLTTMSGSAEDGPKQLNSQNNGTDVLVNVVPAPLMVRLSVCPRLALLGVMLMIVGEVGMSVMLKAPTPVAASVSPPPSDVVTVTSRNPSAAFPVIVMFAGIVVAEGMKR